MGPATREWGLRLHRSVHRAELRQHRVPSSQRPRLNDQGSCSQSQLLRSSTAGIKASNGLCQCNEYHEGTACQHKKCPKSNGALCAGHGTCNQGTGHCDCTHGYYGSDCAEGSGTVIDM